METVSNIYDPNGVPAPLVGSDDGVQLGASLTKPWTQAVDCLVAGFGGAGAAAAIEAQDGGAEVLVVDRFAGGGATKLSGGIYYAGGGTSLQKDAGYDDSIENMQAYVAQEAQGIVADDVLRAFCEQSPENFEWLSSHGISFPSSGKAFKTSYPPNDCTLYFSGNEICAPYNEKAEPAPRGHRPIGKGLTGHLIFKGLRDAVHKRGIAVWTHSRITRLVQDAVGVVIGAEVARLKPGKWRRVIHQSLFQASMSGSMSTTVAGIAQKILTLFERTQSETIYIRARRGVVLATGGFVFNPQMMRTHAPEYAQCSMQLGTPGDYGDGIRLGMGAGGQADNMARCSAFVFINPPSAWVKGLMVGRDGQRVCNEEYYGSTIGVHLTESHGGKGVLILDQAAVDESKEQLRTEYMGGFQKYVGFVNNNINRKTSWTLDGLAQKCGMSVEALTKAVEQYNAGVEAHNDACGKNEKYLQKIEHAPFYAVNMDTDAVLFPTPHFTLGGLRVEGTTQRVMNDKNTIIEGLYACGRTAIGVSSSSYVSGLSVADCIFSGRNAGRAIAVKEASAQAA